MAGQDAQLINQLKKKRLVLFLYRGRGNCRKKIYRKLHGWTDIRIKKTEFGETFEGKYSYKGVSHYDVIPGAFFVRKIDAQAITDFFMENGVPFLAIEPKLAGFSGVPLL